MAVVISLVRSKSSSFVVSPKYLCLKKKVFILYYITLGLEAISWGVYTELNYEVLFLHLG